MKTILLSFLLAFINLISFGQNKNELTVAVSTGLLNSPHYLNAKAKTYYSIDFDYHLSGRQILSVNYTDGKHGYFDNILSNTNGNYYHSDGTNATASYHTFSVLYKYILLNTQYFRGSIGAGAGIMTQTLQYPYSTSSSTYPRDATSTDLVFPVRVEFDFKLTEHFQMGLMGGALVHPDFPLLAFHAGPRIAYTFK